MGYVGGSTGDEEAIRAIVAADVSARVEVLVNVYWPSWQDDLRSARELGVDGVAIVTASSPFFVEGAWNTTYELLSDESAEAVSLAAELGLESCLSIAMRHGAISMTSPCSSARPRRPEPTGSPSTTRSELQARGRCGGCAAGRRRSAMRLSASTPTTTSGSRWRMPLPPSRAGARQLDVCVNGLGDRVGIAPLDEVAASLLLLDGVDTGVDLEAMLELSRLVARLSGVEVPGDEAPRRRARVLTEAG